MVTSILFRIFSQSRDFVFKKAKQILNIVYIYPSSGNCSEDFDSILAGSNYQQVNTSSSSDEDQSQPEAFEVDVTDYKTSSLESNLIGINAITYVAGYLLKKCLLKHHCHICSTALVNNELTDSSQLFCMFKGYESKDKLFGGLVSPSSPFVNMYLLQVLFFTTLHLQVENWLF